MRPFTRPLKIVLCVVAAVFLVVTLCLILLHIAGSSERSMDRATFTVGQIGLLDECLSQYCKNYPPILTSNQQLAEALTGNNPMKKVYLSSWSLPHNRSGELIDPWGDPFRFEQRGDGIVASSGHVPERYYARNWTPLK